MASDDPPSPLVVGVDGCRKGQWAAVGLLGADVADVRTVPAFRDVLLAFPDARVIAVDIPIGLPPPFPRRADIEAKRTLESGRSRVFFTFPRSVYLADSHQSAVELSRATVDTGCSRQAYGLGRRILEVEARVTGRVYEVHPEVSFQALSGRVLPSKKSPDGRFARRSCLMSAGIELPARLRGAAEDDLLDAGVAAWSAGRILRGEALTLPADASTDEPRIWY